MLSIAAKHAIRSLLHLAKREEDQFLSVRQLASETEIPPAYLSKILKILSDAGLLESKKGAGGGVRLMPRIVSFYEVCEALRDPIVLEKCFLFESRCSEISPCPFHEIWQAERRRFLTFLHDSKIRASKE